jgi:hypothetical protein
MIMKRYIALATLATLLFGSASLAFAQNASTTASSTTPTTTSTSTTPASTPVPVPPIIQKGEMKLEIGPRGRVLIRGNVEAVGADYVMIKSWGGVWRVRVSSDTEVLPRVLGTTSDIIHYVIGDYVGAEGVVSTAEGWTINAKVIRDRTSRKQLIKERHENLKDMHETRKEDRKDEHDGEKKISEGKVGTLSGTSFTMLFGAKTMNVTTSAITKFVNRNWNTIVFADIHSGDSIRVYGSTSSSTVAAEVVRDTSIPR